MNITALETILDIENEIKQKTVQLELMQFKMADKILRNKCDENDTTFILVQIIEKEIQKLNLGIELVKRMNKIH